MMTCGSKPNLLPQIRETQPYNLLLYIKKKVILISNIQM